MSIINKFFTAMKNKYAFLCVLAFNFCVSFLHAQSYTIYPIPQKVTEGTGSVELTSQINFICESGIDEFTRNRAEEVFEKAGYTLVEAISPSQTLTNLYVGVNGSNGSVAQYAGNNSLPLTVFNSGDNKFDAHLLQVNGNSTHGDIVVLGDANGSAYYAFATLEQMLEQTQGNSLRQVTFEDYAYMQHRGIVEGFYGHPYSVESRLSLLEFCKRFKMNVFIYGPKADPYHLGNWREDYPTSVTAEQRNLGWITQEDLRALGTKAQNCHVQFVWAAHPGLENGINFTSNSTIDEGVEELMNKFQHLYDLGIRGFGVFIDDMTYTPAGARQAYLADATQKKLREKFPSQDADKKISQLFFVGTTYVYASWTASTLYSYRSIDSDVVIGFTGWEVFSTIEASNISNMADCIGRNPMLWWNNPVNDNYDDRIYMRELTAHWAIETYNPNRLNSLVLNPMQEGQASKVALFGGADYAWNPQKFKDHDNWLASFAHIVQPGDTEAAEALETFARFSNSTIEDDDMIALYGNFQSKYSEGNLPTETAEIRTRLTQLNEACSLIESWQNSEVKDYQLMYEDLRPWNAKLKTMSTIALNALDVLELGNSFSRPEGWEKYRQLQTLFAGMATDSTYMVSALEESGTFTHERYCMVTPGDSQFRPFVEFLVSKTGANAPGEWPAKDQPQIITNQENLSGVTLSTSASQYTLNGLDNLTLAPDEYVGIYFGDVKSISITTLSLDNITLETSSNGKEWSEEQTPINEKITSYIRLKNNTGNHATINIASLSISVISNEVEDTPTASTNMKTYQSNSIDKIIDGNSISFFWAGQPQGLGDYIMLSYTTTQPRYDITLTFTSVDQLVGTAVIEVSTNNSTWEQVAEFSGNEINSNHQYTCNAAGRLAQYVRFRITNSSTNNWLQLAEFSVKTAELFSQTTDNNGANINTLADKDLTTGFQANSAGYIEHSFIENINIESIEIYHNTEFDNQSALPTIAIFNGKEWIEKGNLDSYSTIIDTQEEKMVTKLKISWNEQNIPNIYEILPIGTPYVEPANPNAIENITMAQPAVYVHNNHLVVKAEQAIQAVTLYDMSGRVISHYDAHENSVEIALGKDIPAIFAVQIIDQEGNTFTQKVIQ